MRRQLVTYFKTNIRFLAVISAAFLLLMPHVTLALPDEHKKAIDLDSVHYALPAQGPAESIPCSSESIELSGNGNIAKAFNFLVNDKKLSPAQSAGIVGNLVAESGVIPNRKQGSGTQTIKSASEIVPNVGFGIAQWTSGGRQQNWISFAREKNMDPLSLELQLMYLWHELETVPNYGLDEINKAQDVRQAAWIFLVYFERPAATSGYEEKSTQATGGSAKTELDHRERLAQSVLNQGNSPSGGSGTTSTSSSSDSCSSGGVLTGSEEVPDFKKNPKVKVDDPPQVPFNESQCSGTFTPGASSLQKLVMNTYSPPVTSVGGYDCRQNTADVSISVHGLGRALDIMIDGTTPKGLEVGDKIRNFMINNSTQLGVQRVIWNHHIWSADQDGWRDYTGPNPHTDHLHVEINLKASENQNLGGGGVSI